MVKRVFDFILAILGILLLSPFFALFSFLLLLTQGFPIFFMQERVGYRGKPFKIIKFRTMKAGAESGGALTVGQDSRITAIGQFYRKFKIDELPQLINVLKGDMSFVGPRPEVPRYVFLYSPEQKKVLDLMPGITDPASIKYARESEMLGQSNAPEKIYVDEILPDKISINLKYADQATLLSDIGVIFKTILFAQNLGK